jgi:hypothetical protein
MLRRGVPEGKAIATANARIKRLRRTGAVSNSVLDKYRRRPRFGQFAGNDQQPIDASSR